MQSSSRIAAGVGIKETGTAQRYVEESIKKFPNIRIEKVGRYSIAKPYPIWIVDLESGWVESVKLARLCYKLERHIMFDTGKSHQVQRQ
jgi:hypothetical protein